MSAEPSRQQDDETERALEALMQDPEAAQTAIRILREELRSATDLERKGVMATIALLERSSPAGR